MSAQEREKVRRAITSRLLFGECGIRTLLQNVVLNVNGYRSPQLYSATVRAIKELRAEGVIALTGKSRAARYHLLYQ